MVISEKCSSVPENTAMKHVAGYALALDMTARDFQVWIRHITYELEHWNLCCHLTYLKRVAMCYFFLGNLVAENNYD